MKEMSKNDEGRVAVAAEETPENARRAFMKRYGTYAAGTALGLFILMSPKTSKAIGSDGAP